MVTREAQNYDQVKQSVTGINDGMSEYRVTLYPSIKRRTQ